MPIECKYNRGRILDIDFSEHDNCQNIDTSQHYHIILISKGSLTLNIDDRILTFVAPCVVLLKENLRVVFVSSHILQSSIIKFHVGFLNINITYDLINSGKYETEMEKYAFIPLNVFCEKSDKYFGFLPLSKDTYMQIGDLFLKFNSAIMNQTDKRWSCRARLYLNAILELLYQVYCDYLNDNIMNYDIKDPHVWVSLILQKIHNNYSKNISLITLSKDIHINKSTVAKYFRDIIGYSVTEYIIDYRIKCACYSLSTTEIKIGELSVECGFTSEAYFIKQFKARVGMTPSEYRKNKVNERKMAFKHF